MMVYFNMVIGGKMLRIPPELLEKDRKDKQKNKDNFIQEYLYIEDIPIEKEKLREEKDDIERGSVILIL